MIKWVNVMSNYIDEATKLLDTWLDNLDVDLFIQQYEALDHSHDSILLEDFDGYLHFCLNSAEKAQQKLFEPSSDAISLKYVEEYLSADVTSLLMNDYDVKVAVKNITTSPARRLIPAWVNFQTPKSDRSGRTLSHFASTSVGDAYSCIDDTYKSAA